MSAICSICQKAKVTVDYQPFCSKRCADVDLGRWLKGGYAIPTDERAPDNSGFTTDEFPTPEND